MTHEGVRDAFVDLDRVFRSSSWFQPRRMAWHRRNLAAAAEAGSDTYEEHFDYPEADVAGYLEAVDRIETLVRTNVTNAVMRPLLRASLDRRRVNARLAVLRQDDAYTEAQAEQVGVPSRQLVNLALAMLETPHTHEDANADIDAATMRQAIRTALTGYCLHGWRVECEPDMAAKASVNGSLRRIRVRSDAQFTPAAAERLVVHEVGGHVLRWANASHQDDALASLPLGSTTALEEGLALWREEELEVGSAAATRIYALRVVAVDQARTLGIMPLIRELTRWVDLPTSVETALRVKRGLIDPNGPGGATNDHCYLAGLITVQELPSHLRQRCLAVKWDLDHVLAAQPLFESGTLRPPILEADRDILLAGLPVNGPDAPTDRLITTTTG